MSHPTMLVYFSVSALMAATGRIRAARFPADTYAGGVTTEPAMWFITDWVL